MFIRFSQSTMLALAFQIDSCLAVINIVHIFISNVFIVLDCLKVLCPVLTKWNIVNLVKMFSFDAANVH